MTCSRCKKKEVIFDADDNVVRTVRTPLTVTSPSAHNPCPHGDADDEDCDCRAKFLAAGSDGALHTPEFHSGSGT